MRKTILLLASMVVTMVFVSGVALATPKKNLGDTGGTQNDTVTVSTVTFIYNGEVMTATVYEGTSGNDTIIGTSGMDYISGNGGDDIISGEAGSDALYGGSGNDQIRAADGAEDVVYCGTGIDKVEADSVDRLYDCEEVTYPSASQ